MTCPVIYPDYWMKFFTTSDLCRITYKYPNLALTGRKTDDQETGDIKLITMIKEGEEVYLLL